MTLFRLAALALAPVLLCACGNPGSPLPPSLKLPDPVVDLHADRLGDMVTLHWTMPRRSTDRLLLQGDQRAAVCRAVDAGPCERIGERLLQPAAPATVTDSLPAALRTGQPRLLRYEVRLDNKAGRDAGVSNPAFAAAGPAPPPVRAVEAAMSAHGVEVRWQAPADASAPASEEHARLLVRLVRDRVLAPGESEKPTRDEAAAGVPPPPQQLLETEERAPAHTGDPWQPDHTVDADARSNRSYRYAVQLVQQETLGGHTVEVSGLPAYTGVLAARDIYPPSVPAELSAVANAQEHTIDLSWSADADPDVAGYFVYSRRAGSSGLPERVSGRDPLPNPSWRDAHAADGVRYSYSVSAVDASGNESARSPEVTEALPE